MPIDKLAASALCAFIRVLTGVRPIWYSRPAESRRIYFANHRSHGDFLLIWAALPNRLREFTRPVAGADYWLESGLRRYIATRVFRSVLINRKVSRSTGNPIEQMSEAINGGNSLIIFPEGTRNLGDGLLPFKSGLFHLARAHPEVQLIPVWIENLGRVMPKGAFIPAPLLCTLTFGEPLSLEEGEKRDDFLARASSSLLALAPDAD